MGVKAWRICFSKSALICRSSWSFSAELAAYCFQRGIVITGGVLGAADGILGDALQIAPPFIITEQEIDRVVDTLRQGILEIGQTLQPRV